MALSGPGEEGGIEEAPGVFSEINITPLTDIFLVLLIIFMIGAAMAVDAASGQRSSAAEGTGLQIDLPRGAARDIEPGGSDVVVAILSDGRVVLKGDEVAQDQLGDRLEAALRTAPSSTLILQADEGVPHGRVVAVMETARAAGFTRLAVATRGD